MYHGDELKQMAGRDQENGGIHPYGTVLEIKHMELLPGGRSMIETVGVHRFKLVNTGTLDGYTIAQIERIDDIPPDEEAEAEVEAVTVKVNVNAKVKEEPWTPEEDALIRSGTSVDALKAIDARRGIGSVASRLASLIPD